MENLTRLANFIHERHEVYLNRASGMTKPWTWDPILQKYRFCNVYRELDKVTQWVATNWRAPHKDDPDVWFAMAVARYTNKIETMEELGYPVPWDPEKFSLMVSGRRADKKAVINSAYRIPVRGPKGETKFEHIQGFLTRLWHERKSLRPLPTDSLEDFYRRLVEVPGIGAFMAGQIIADTKYTEPLLSAPDWHTWVTHGPGSIRGAKRVDPSWSYKTKSFRECITEMHSLLAPLITDLPALHMQDLQNCLCEFDKYERVRLGEGRPKSRYPGI